MQIPEYRIDDYIAIYREKYGKEISRAKALEELTALVTFMSAVDRFNNSPEERKHYKE